MERAERAISLPVRRDGTSGAVSHSTRQQLPTLHEGPPPADLPLPPPLPPLHDAAARGDAEAVRALARAPGADVAAGLGDNTTALHFASDRGHVREIPQNVLPMAVVSTGSGCYSSCYVAPFHVGGRG